ncbi:MAG: hypothetical protein ACREPX_03865 [Rhodanobacteraceae bacterium]
MFLLRLLLCLACGFSLSARAADAPAASGYEWPNLTDFFKQLIDRVGAPVKVYRLEMDRDGKVELLIQDQRQRDIVDRYEYADGAMTGPSPVKFERYPSIEALDHHVIELTTIEFQRLPGMLETAKGKLSLPDAEVSSIGLERGDSSGMLTFSDLPIWTFHIETPRHDGHVEFSLDGRVLNAEKD